MLIVLPALAMAAASCRTGRADQSKPSAPTVTTGEAPTTGPGSTQPGPGPPASLSGKVVVVDPGHDGGNGSHVREINRQVDAGGFQKECDTTGAETDGGYTESRFNFQVANMVAELLRGAGAQVDLTRMSDTGWGPCIDERAATGNRDHADVAVSIHADGGPVGGRGFHVIYAPATGLSAPIGADSKRLARVLRDAYEGATGLPRSTYLGSEGLDVRTDLGGLNLSTVPKVFIECGNLRNPVDATLLTSDAFQAQAARGISEGLRQYLVGP